MAELERAYSYDEKGQPVMVIYKKRPPVKTFRLKIPKVEAYIIPLDDAFMFSHDHYPALVRVFYGYDQAGNAMHGEKVLTYDQAMFAKCEELCHQFDLGLITSRKMADIASMIEDGIDELVKMPPQTTEAVVLGQVKFNDGNGGERTIEMTEERVVL